LYLCLLVITVDGTRSANLVIELRARTPRGQCNLTLVDLSRRMVGSISHSLLLTYSVKSDIKITAAA